jgi:hypothetical protein
MSTTQPITKVVEVHVSSTCAESYPCQHQCYAILRDGSKVRVSTFQLIEEPYWSLLSKGNQMHFAYLHDYLKN